MATREHHTRSLSCVELIGLLDDACEALIELDIALADDGGLAPVRRALRLDRELALRMLAERCGQIEAVARACCCVSEVPHLEAVLRVDGERVSVARFPEAALGAVGPLYDHLMRVLGESGARPAEGVDEDSDRFPVGA